MTRRTTIVLSAAIWGALMTAGCKETTPNRNFIPAIKQQVFLLQEAIKNRDSAALDSLLTNDYVNDHGIDSVLQFAYGDDPSFRFERFGRAEIFYTDDRARVDGNLTGADGAILKDVVLVYRHTGSKWLLSSIGPRTEPIDSVTPATDSAAQEATGAVTVDSVNDTTTQ